MNGVVRVPEGPGLGVTLDRDELESIKKQELPAQPKWLIKSQFKNGTRMFNIGDTDNSIFMVRPDVNRLIPMSYASLISTEYWDDDGTPEYKTMFERIERDGIVLEQ